MRETFADSTPSDSYLAERASRQTWRNFLLWPARLLGMRTDDFAGIGAAIFSAAVWAALGWFAWKKLK